MEKAISNERLDLVDGRLESFYQIRSEAGKLRKQYPQLREGQAIYTVAQKKFPSFVKTVSLDDDCFYVDDRIESFLAAVLRQISS